jgi:hypothetical protein
MSQPDALDAVSEIESNHRQSVQFLSSSINENLAFLFQTIAFHSQQGSVT